MGRVMREKAEALGAETVAGSRSLDGVDPGLGDPLLDRPSPTGRVDRGRDRHDPAAGIQHGSLFAAMPMGPGAHRGALSGAPGRRAIRLVTWS